MMNVLKYTVQSDSCEYLFNSNVTIDRNWRRGEMKQQSEVKLKYFVELM